MNKSGFIFSLIMGFFSLVGIGSAIAQSTFGVKGAFNYSTFRKNPDLKAGYQLGLTYKRYMGELGWYFQPEINYSLEGVVNQPLEFINVPLILGFDFSENFNLHTGFQFGFLVGTRGVETNNYKTFNPAINIGLEFYPSKKTGVGFRGDYGLSDIDKSSTRSVTLNYEVYILVWLISQN